MRLLTLLLLSGCTHAMDPITVRANDTSKLASVDARDRPVIVEFQPGDTLPLYVTVDSDLVGATTEAPMLFVAKQRFFLRRSKDGLAMSKDGLSFDAKPVKPGSFRFGVGVNAQGPRAELHLVTPRR